MCIIHMDRTQPLPGHDEIVRYGGKVCGYVVWYEDFSLGCSFYGDEGHAIDVYALVCSTKREVHVKLLKILSKR